MPFRLEKRNCAGFYILKKKGEKEGLYKQYHIVFIFVCHNPSLLNSLGWLLTPRSLGVLFPLFRCLGYHHARNARISAGTPTPRPTDMEIISCTPRELSDCLLLL